MHMGAGKHIAARRKPVDREEQDFQIAVVNLLTLALLPGTMFFHVPNGGKRNRIEAAILKAMGVKAGFPDLGILHLGRLFTMEAKRRKGGKLSKAQQDCHEELRAAGVPVVEIRTVDDVLRALVAWSIPTRIKGAMA